MSQAAVNRTAMYHISHHVYGLLEAVRSGCQFFGQVFDQIPSASALGRLQREAFETLLPDPDGFVARCAKAPITSLDAQTLYLDPLYTLFGDLKSSDTVFVLDLSTVTTPAWHRPNVSRAYSLAFDAICTRHPNVVAISQNTADTLYANYGFPRERTRVLPLYVPHHFEEAGAGAAFPSPQPYVLFVGSLETRKNLVGAIRSFALSGLGTRGYRCLIAGGAGHGSDEIQHEIATVPNVFLTGYVTNEELHALYRGARAFLYPSYLEGFGIPLLEAMHFGVPAVASTTGACPEVGGSLVRCFDPDDHVAFARELIRLVQLDASERAAYTRDARLWIGERYSVARFDDGMRAVLGIGMEQVA